MRLQELIDTNKALGDTEDIRLQELIILNKELADIED